MTHNLDRFALIQFGFRCCFLLQLGGLHWEPLLRFFTKPHRIRALISNDQADGCCCVSRTMLSATVIGRNEVIVRHQPARGLCVELFCDLPNELANGSPLPQSGAQMPRPCRGTPATTQAGLSASPLPFTLSSVVETSW